MSFVAIAMLGVLAFIRLPVSLMPETEIPRLRVELSYPDASPIYMEKSILQPLRLSLQGLYQLQDIESIAASGTGQISLTFSYGTDMKLAYIETNEKLDQSLRALPRDMSRPVVRRLQHTDIPVARLQVSSDSLDIMVLSDLSRFVLKRRIEQLDGVSLVEMNGAVRPVYRLLPNPGIMSELDVSISDLENTLIAANVTLNQIKVREGIYEYDITFRNLLADPDHLDQLRIFTKNGRSVPLTQLARMEVSTARPLGKHLINGRQGIVFAIHKQEQRPFGQVDQRIRVVEKQFRQDFPMLDFMIVQDQAGLLKDSIRQLVVSLLLGIVLAFGILFAFSGEWRSPMLMGFLIPVSLLLTMGMMYILGISINIISLSGMILGIGVLIDNGIIIIDNINRHRERDKDIPLSAAGGTREIVPALVNATLTTLSVFVPLVLLEGLPGFLFRVQAYTLAVVLTGSLLASFVFLPVMYRIFRPHSTGSSSLFSWILRKYELTRQPAVSKGFVIAFGLILLSGVWLLLTLPVSNLPAVVTKDLQIHVNWDDALTLTENESRVKAVMSSLEGVELWEADIGRNDIYEEGINIQPQFRLYIRFVDEMAKQKAVSQIGEWFRNRFPHTAVNFRRAKNPYDQIFVSDEPYLSLRLRTGTDSYIGLDELTSVLNASVVPGEGFQEQESANIVFDRARMYSYGLTEDQIVRQLQYQFNDQLVTTINKINESIPLVIRGNEKITKNELDRISVVVRDSIRYPVSYFFDFRSKRSPRFITADIAGGYQELIVEENNTAIPETIRQVKDLARANGWILSMGGSYLKEEANLNRLILSFGLAVMLLYVILAAQFESLKLPLIILAEIPVSASGSLIFLGLFGETLNVSSLIGMVVMLGIIVNDSILKVDTINRYRKEGMSKDNAIRQGGKDRLKPILMTTLTTVLAVTPILLSKGIGGDLQGPLAISVIGGLLVGTFCSIYLVPVLYRVLISR